MSEEKGVNEGFADVDMVELLQDEFMEDPLYREILANSDLRLKLFPEFIKGLHPKKQYTTLEVSEMIEEKDSTVRYYMNTLLEYIQPIRNNRNYRLMYDSIYKLYLVFLYTRDYGRNTNDVKMLLPMFPDSQIVEGRVVNNSDVSVKQRKTSINDGYLLGFLLNLAEYNQTNEDSQYELHNKYIDFFQTKTKHDKVIQKIRSTERELNEEEINLVHLHQELSNLNLELAIKTMKEKDTFAAKLVSVLRKMFKTEVEEEEEVSFFSVKDDDPKIQSQKEKINATENGIKQLMEKLKELEKEENTYINEMTEIHSSLNQLFEQVPQLKNNKEIASLLSVYSREDSQPDEKES
ncbi:hypothetical protein [Virgibacillus halodenitrificans]|uniref:hypothetical protein n=1 Tax=Virgibacillus halodenitrificans TaxID=1482 RepID=UPI000EF4556F|nr:hypothetical protein [Virgibacillus halodenitrificans]